jgi:4-hydroxy-3-methylbut-2-enyl diphosphate reductase
MKIHLAAHSGFCMGVRSAILKIISEINLKKRSIYVYGPLIHNPQTVHALSERGLITINSLDNITGKEIAIRTHGITDVENRTIKNNASKVINLTCPRVARVQAIIKKYSNLGYSTLIIGDRNHAEVTGLISYARNGHIVISSPEEIPRLDPDKKYVLVSQTTFDRVSFRRIIESLPHGINTEIIDTICDSTLNRQSDVSEAVKKGINKLVVIGGKNSANTSRLADIGAAAGISTYHIETEDELKVSDFSKNDEILVTAGASTPGWIINNVLERLYSIRYKKSNFIINSLKMLLEFSVRINLVSAAGAYLITSFNQKVLYGTDHVYLNIFSSLYLLSMYSVNNFFDLRFLSKTNIYKYSIYKKFGKILFILSIASMLFSLYLASDMPGIIKSIILITYIIGFLYSTSIIHKTVSWININPARKIYNSRVVTAFGWLIYAVGMPAFYNGYIDDGFFTAAAAVFLFIFIRQQLLDIVAFQGDLILGRETLTIWLSPARMNQILTASAVAGIFLIVSLSIFQNTAWISAYITILIYYQYLLRAIIKQNYVISLKYELLIDAAFFLFGIIYLIHDYSHNQSSIF